MNKFKTLLYTDTDIFHAVHDGKESIASIARAHGINTKIRLIAHVFNIRHYRADKTGVRFTIEGLFKNESIR